MVYNIDQPHKKSPKAALSPNSPSLQASSSFSNRLLNTSREQSHRSLSSSILYREMFAGRAPLSSLLLKRRSPNRRSTTRNPLWCFKSDSSTHNGNEELWGPKLMCFVKTNTALSQAPVMAFLCTIAADMYPEL